MTPTITTLVFLALVFLMAVIITRWIFGIDQIIKQLKLNNSILKMIAEKDGLLNDEQRKFIDKTIGRV
jgi:hypothetical protein